MIRDISEHEHAKYLMLWAGYVEINCPHVSLLFAIPNGGHRKKGEAGKMKAEGVKAGVPDYFLPVARGKYHGLFIELKTVKGKLSKPQKIWKMELEEQGFKVEVCHGWEAAAKAITNYLKTKRG